MTPSALAPITQIQDSTIVAAAETFSLTLAAVEARLRRRRDTLPAPEHRRAVAAAFWRLVEALDRAEASGPVAPEAVRACREIAGRWLFRSRYWNRAYHKPHGYAGDFVAIEWLYDLESDPCADPVQPAIVNCLDDLLTSVPAVVSVWERRRFFADLLRAEHTRRAGRLRVLDVAGGGARYLRDFLAAITPGPQLEVTIVDQDPAASAYCRTRSLADWPGHVELVCAPIRELPALIAGRSFDVVISAGLFDYLAAPSARALLATLAAHLAPGGVIALSNFHRTDPSRLVKKWLCDWPLIYRDEEEGARLFPDALAVATQASANGALLYVTGRKAAG